MKKRLIITADDFGYSEGRNYGIVECYKRGAISRVSLLVNAVKSSQAVELAKKYSIPLGLHINLSEGHPLSDPADVPFLIDPDTKEMLGKMGFREALKQGRLDMPQVLLEILAQIEKFKEMTKLDPIYVDGHQHVHILPGVCEIFAAIPAVTETRLPLEPNVISCDWIKDSQQQFFSTITENCQSAIDVFRKNRVSFSQGFVGLSTMGSNMTFKRLTKQLSNAFNSKDSKNSWGNVDRITCELMVHPGYPTKVENNLGQSELLTIAGCGNGPDDFEQSKDRNHEINVLCAERFQNWVQSENIAICKNVMKNRELAKVF